PLAERVWEELRGLIPFELAALEVDEYDQTTKTTRVWGEDRKGRATPKDRVMVLRRVVVHRTGTVHGSSKGGEQHGQATNGAGRRRARKLLGRRRHGTAKRRAPRRSGPSARG